MNTILCQNKNASIVCALRMQRWHVWSFLSHPRQEVFDVIQLAKVFVMSRINHTISQTHASPFNCTSISNKACIDFSLKYQPFAVKFEFEHDNFFTNLSTLAKYKNHCTLFLMLQPEEPVKKRSTRKENDAFLLELLEEIPLPLRAQQVS